MNGNNAEASPYQNVFLALGSNMGDRLAHLQSAMHALAQEPGISIIKVSSVYETEPWGLTGQRTFYNAVVWIKTRLLPLDLLHLCQQIEQKQKRVRDVRWGPRTLDIDILRYGSQVVNSLELTIPHARMEERDFVMVPLAEIENGSAPDRPGIRRIIVHWYPADDNPGSDL